MHAKTNNGKPEIIDAKQAAGGVDCRENCALSASSAGGDQAQQGPGRAAVPRDNMTVSQTPISAVERKRARRHKIARRLYEQLVAQNPNRVITLRDGGGRVVARHERRPAAEGAPEIAS